MHIIRYIKCIYHGKEFISFCNKCKKNLCQNCEKEHYNHEIILYKRENLNASKINKIEEKISSLVDKLKEYKFQIQIFNELYNKFINNYYVEINNYYKFNKKIEEIMKYIKNYETIINIKEFKIDELTKNIDNFLKNDIRNKMKFLINLFDKNLNCLNMIYQVGEYPNVKILGAKFVENNKNNCCLYADNEIFGLSEYFFKKDYKNNKKLEIKLIKMDEILDQSYMFSECENLISFEQYSWNTINVRNMGFIFDGCKKLTSLPDISKWNTKNVQSMRGMFYNCKKLTSLPDISKWNTKKVEDMGYMFHECKNLSYLPDISKWNTNNVNYMDYMFWGCKKLSSLPDISKWSVHNVKNMEDMFGFCSKLSYFPDISQWNTISVINMTNMFCYCENLSVLPNISKWNTINVRYNDLMFNGCWLLVEKKILDGRTCQIINKK